MTTPHQKIRRFERLYRPKTFSDVRGQSAVTDELSALIRRGKLRRPMLFAGDRGSGKTSLVRIYAKGLTCESNLADGSPCETCARCNASTIKMNGFSYDERGLFEYDTAAAGGSKNEIERFLEVVRRRDISETKRIAFFDEAHTLSEPAMQALLKVIEEEDDNLTFCFATTAAGRLDAALRSRLWTYSIRALPDRLAIELLRDVAAKENVSIDLEAIKILAAVKRNYPRDLLIGLSQMAVLGEHITVAAVKQAFGVNQIDVLTAYFTALANGDKVAQASVFRQWNETPFVKAQWISAFLVSLFFNHILGVERMVDPLIHAATEGHGGLAESWAKRLGLSDKESRVRYWERLLAFWARNRPRDDSTASLAIALFESTVDRRDPLVTETVSSRSASPDEDLQSVSPSTSALQRKLKSEPNTFVTSLDVGDIINRASFFAQHHGAFFNVRLDVEPGEMDEASNIATLDSFGRAFQARFDGQSSGGDAPFAASLFIDRVPDRGVVGFVAAHISFRGDYELAVAQLQEFIAGYERSHKITADFRMLPNRGQALSFHWDSVLTQIAGYDDTPRKSTPGFKSLVQTLGVRKRREPRQIRGRRIFAYGATSDHALLDAQRFKMTFLSAFNDRAYDWVRKGWELKEAVDRRKDIEDRDRRFRDLSVMYGADPTLLKTEERKLEDGWPSDADKRSRLWRGWW